jgi:hypothetical protein
MRETALSQALRWKGLPRPGEVVYLAEATGSGLVKIGWSRHVKDRIKNHCHSGARPADVAGRQVVLVASRPGTHHDERTLHDRFAALRVSGEWFQDEPAIRAAFPAGGD